MQNRTCHTPPIVCVQNDRTTDVVLCSKQCNGAAARHDGRARGSRQETEHFCSTAIITCTKVQCLLRDFIIILQLINAPVRRMYSQPGNLFLGIHSMSTKPAGGQCSATNQSNQETYDIGDPTWVPVHPGLIIQFCAADRYALPVCADGSATQPSHRAASSRCSPSVQHQR